MTKELNKLEINTDYDGVCKHTEFKTTMDRRGQICDLSELIDILKNLDTKYKDKIK